MTRRRMESATVRGRIWSQVLAFGTGKFGPLILACLSASEPSDLFGLLDIAIEIKIKI
jgi:hypothetical protein